MDNLKPKTWEGPLPEMSRPCADCEAPKSVHDSLLGPAGKSKDGTPCYHYVADSSTTHIVRSDVHPSFRGAHFYRIDAKYRRYNLREMLFVFQWQKENGDVIDAPYGGQLLAKLLGHEPTPQEWETAATVIQWLGSNIGQCFLREVEDDIKKLKSEPRSFS